MKTHFNLRQFLIDQRLAPHELATEMGLSTAAIYVIARRGTVKTSFIRTLEEKYGDCSQYIGNHTEQPTVLVAE
jgi:DNA-binding Xre family transcriptional regulator